MTDPYPEGMPERPLRIVLVEDSLLLREGLVRLFDEAGYITAAAFGDAHDIVARVRDAAADVAILDVRLPPSFRDEGIKAALLLRAQVPELGILVLSQYIEGVYARELLAAGDGGVGYLLKDRVTSLEEFTDAVRRVHERGTVLDPLVVQGLLAGRPNPLAALTPRERDVLELMAEGRSNASIAARLFIGVGAVEKNVSAIFAKLGLEESATEHRRVLAVIAYLQHPLTEARSLPRWSNREPPPISPCANATPPRRPNPSCARSTVTSTLVAGRLTHGSRLPAPAGVSPGPIGVEVGCRSSASTTTLRV